MNKSQFAERIKSFDFSTLFNELGWDRFEDKLHPVTIDKMAYPLTGIAQKRGFVIVQCGAGADGRIPPSPVRSKIERAFAKHYQEHIIIFVNDSRTEQKWQYIIPEENRPRRIRCADYRKGQAPELLYQKMKNLVFSIDEEENISLIDVLKRVNENFAKNTEQVTKKFYDSFKKYHTAFMAFISGIDDAIPDKTNSNKQWYASLMMNRLMFCYFIQKKGFLDGNINYLSDKLHECQEKHGKDKFFSFYRQFLLVLFHDNLGKPEEKRPAGFEVKFGKIPYLNGGLFDVHELERKYDDIQINDKAFQDIFAFFDEWQWHLDTSDHGDGRHINPDVIGYIFEKYINDRAEMGAYYTKEDITNYIGQNCILPFLFDKTAKTCPAVLKPDGFVWTYLKGSCDTYIYDAVKHGVPEAGGDLHAGLPEDVLQGFDDELAQKIVSDETKVHLWQKRQCWNRKVDDSNISLPTETWRELIARRERCAELRQKIASGAITRINDFITFNLNIRQFTQDVVENCPDPAFIKEFYKALKSVTILDPTCGSGAFLFAALNILEPLYAACIRRMEDFVAEAKPGHFKFFEEELAEVNNEKHPNQEYFIYKSIILHNLYGVDIMKEAVEIAKLRLFLKLVATVDVNRRKANMGLEPLPDIDFNIRAGNTLVGFATRDELMQSLRAGLFTRLNVDDFEEDCEILAKTFIRYQNDQLVKKSNYESKAAYRKRLEELNEKLNRQLAYNYGIDANSPKTYAKWKESHRPFHWFTEFYEIVANNGGFDVVIGNPPYVTINADNVKYKIKAFESVDCGDLFGVCLERAGQIINSNGEMGFIVPLSLTATQKMEKVRQKCCSILSEYWASYYSASAQPSCLFDGVRHRLMIHIGHVNKAISKNFSFYTTNFLKWLQCERVFLFEKIYYSHPQGLKQVFCKTSDESGIRILKKMESEKKIVNFLYGDHPLYYHNAPVYWGKVFDFIPLFKKGNFPPEQSSHVKTILAPNKYEKYGLIALLNSTLFYWYNWQYSNCRDLSKANIENFPCNLRNFSHEEIYKIARDLMKDYLLKKKLYTRVSSGVTTIFDSFYPAESKSIIDQIDQYLATYYGFSERELDYIISYDYKYRIGNEED